MHVQIVSRSRIIIISFSNPGNQKHFPKYGALKFLLCNYSSCTFLFCFGGRFFILGRALHLSVMGHQYHMMARWRDRLKLGLLTRLNPNLVYCFCSRSHLHLKNVFRTTTEEFECLKVLYILKLYYEWLWRSCIFVAVVKFAF